MRKCYKCERPYGEPGKPGFQDICPGCESYVHCCMNCRFYDEGANNHCNEPQAEYVSDTHGMNRCEYFEFRLLQGEALVEDPEDPEARRRRRRPDWRNLGNKDDGMGRKRERRARNPFGDRATSSTGSRNPFGDAPGGRGDRAQKAREALERLFKKPEE